MGQGGVTWKEFNRAAAGHGLATTGGVVSTTGIAGLTLGDGEDWLMGKYGLTTDNLAGGSRDGRRRDTHCQRGKPGGPLPGPGDSGQGLAGVDASKPSRDAWRRATMREPMPPQRQHPAGPDRGGRPVTCRDLARPGAVATRARLRQLGGQLCHCRQLQHAGVHRASIGWIVPHLRDRECHEIGLRAIEHHTEPARGMLTTIHDPRENAGLREQTVT